MSSREQRVSATRPLSSVPCPCARLPALRPPAPQPRRSPAPNIELTVGSQVRLWVVSDMTCKSVLTGADEALYSLSWSADDAQIAASTLSGAVVVFDVRKAAAIRTLRVHAQRSLRVAFSPHDAGLLASVADDKRLVVYDPDGKGVADVTQPSRLKGLAWHPADGNIVATVDEEGSVRLIAVRGVKVLAKAQHPGKSAGFSLEWSSLDPRHLLTTHSDTTAAVWSLAGSGSDYSLTLHKTLVGHSDRVRAAMWHPEIPSLALTGSWDSTIRLWDVRTGSCIGIFPLHRADVYQIAAHPSRPFTLASVSRDSTTRVFTLADTLLPIVSRAVLRLPFTGPSTEVPPVGGALLLCGEVGQRLEARLGVSDPPMPTREAVRAADRSSLVRALEAVAEVLLPPDGSLALVELLKTHLVAKEGAERGSTVEHSRKIPYVTVVEDVLNERAQQLEMLRATTRVRGIGAAAKRAELMGNAAHAHLMAGNLGQCCDLLVELGRWEEALSLSILEGPEKYRDVLLQVSTPSFGAL